MGIKLELKHKACSRGVVIVQRVCDQIPIGRGSNIREGHKGKEVSLFTSNKMKANVTDGLGPRTLETDGAQSSQDRPTADIPGLAIFLQFSRSTQDRRQATISCEIEETQCPRQQIELPNPACRHRLR